MAVHIFARLTILKLDVIAMPNDHMRSKGNDQPDRKLDQCLSGHSRACSPGSHSDTISRDMQAKPCFAAVPCGSGSDWFRQRKAVRGNSR